MSKVAPITVNVDEALALEGRRDTGETTNRVFALQALYRQTRAGAGV